MMLFHWTYVHRESSCMCPTVTNLAVWWPRPISTRPGSTQTCGRSSTTLWSGKYTWRLKLNDVGKAKKNSDCPPVFAGLEGEVCPRKLLQDLWRWEDVCRAGNKVRKGNQGLEGQNTTSHVEYFQIIIIIDVCCRIILGLIIYLCISALSRCLLVSSFLRQNVWPYGRNHGRPWRVVWWNAQGKHLL